MQILEHPAVGDMVHLAVIALGSNIDKFVNMARAERRLVTAQFLSIRAASSMIETAAIGPDGELTDQSSYLNMAVWGETALDFHALRRELRAIEADLGRRRTENKATPILIDLDIVIFARGPEDTIYLDPDLTTALHVAVPIAEILPDWVHPERGQSMRTIAELLTTQ